VVFYIIDQEEQMKPGQALLYVLIFSFLTVSACERKKEIEGVWEFVSSKYTTPDTTIVNTQADWNAIKVITRSRFATVGQQTNRPRFGDEITDADIVKNYNTFSANGGTYTAEKGIYTEYLTYFSNPNRVNTSEFYNYEIKGDQFIISSKAGDTSFQETWRKVE
jgi:hypothetical protein